jgi:hypothetical protein
VHEVVDDGVLDARIDEIAAGLATRSTGAIALTKAWWLQITDTLIDKTWQYARDNRAMLAAARSADIPARFRAPDGR